MIPAYLSFCPQNASTRDAEVLRNQVSIYCEVLRAKLDWAISRDLYKISESCLWRKELVLGHEEGSHGNTTAPMPRVLKIQCTDQGLYDSLYHLAQLGSCSHLFSIWGMTTR